MKVYQFAQTHFSLGSALLEPAEVAQQTKELEKPVALLSDSNTVSGMTEFVDECNKLGLDYVISASVTVVADPKLREKKAHNPMYQLRIIVKNDEGMKDLFEILSLANSEEYFYFHPRTSLYDIVKVASRGNVIVTTNDMNSPLLLPNATDIVRNLVDTVPEFYLEAPLLPTGYFESVCDAALELIENDDSERLQLIITRTAMYKKGQDDTRDHLSYIVNGSSFKGAPAKSELRPIPQYRDAYLMSSQELKVSCNVDLLKRLLPHAVSFHERCDYKWERQEISLPKLAEDEFGELVNKCKEGWQLRFSKPVFDYKPSAEDMPVYKERLKYELGIIKEMGFVPYFLLVSYVVNWSKENKIAVGPARGSAAGSLVAYLMGITDVDPIRFGLIFERFLNPDRLDYPDIDLDFMSSRRQNVVEHLEDKFGKEYVAGISNYSKLGGSSTIRDLGRTHGLSNSEINVSKKLNEMTLEEALEQDDQMQGFAEKYPEIIEQIDGLQGKLRTLSQHAAGLIVAGVPIRERAVLETRKGATVNWDKSNVEDQGLIKLDLLGLSTLDILRIALDFLEERDIKLNLNAIPLDDKKTLQLFAEGRTKGVFQFEGGNARKLLKDIAEGGEMTFEDIVAVNALNRPGPLDAGLSEQYCKIRSGQLNEAYVHGKAEPALKETFGVMVYQEQIMRLSQDLAGFTMAQADILRKAVGKKDAEKMATMSERFINGCVDSGMLERDAQQLWDDIEGFAAYSFNKSHAVAYSLISYQCGYIKANYPAVFYAASMSILSDDKVGSVARDAANDGVIILPPDINKSSGKFEIVYDTARECEVLYTPLDRVKYVSGKSVEAILEARKNGPFESIEDLRGRVDGRKLNKRAIENLDSIGAFADIEPDQKHPLHADRVRAQKEVMGAFAMADVSANRRMNFGLAEPTLLKMYQDKEKEYDVPIEVVPKTGKRPYVMMIVDAPNYYELQKGELLDKKTRGTVEAAIKNAGFGMAEVYYTTLFKTEKPKFGEEIDPNLLKAYKDIIKEEVAIMDPAICILSGSMTVRAFHPDVKGGIEELSGQDVYDVDGDRTYLFTVSPGMIYMKPELTEEIENAFIRAAEMVGK